MAITTRQSSLLVAEDWTKLYQTFRNADFQSYDYETLRKAMVDYLRIYYPEDFNDFIESSEFIALIDLIAFLGQSLAFRTDLNARENFIDTAQRRDSILKLARLISYSPKRNISSSGFLKIDSISTTENVFDSNGLNLSGIVVDWNDSSNLNWLEQFTAIINASLNSNQVIGKPSNSQVISGITNEEYGVNIVPTVLPVYAFEGEVEGSTFKFEAISPTSVNQSYIYEQSPRTGGSFNMLYKNDNLGNGSVNTGFFMYFKQGTLKNLDFNLEESIPNRVFNVNIDNINNSDIWLYSVDANGQLGTLWKQVAAVGSTNVIYNQSVNKNIYQVNTRAGDQVDLVFGDGSFANIPQGRYRLYYRQSNGLDYKITPDEMQGVNVNVNYVSRTGRVETLAIRASLQYTVANASSRETIDEIRQKAPQQYYTQNRMVTSEDYNILPYTLFSSIIKLKAVNRSSSGVSRYLDVIDTTGKYSSTNIFGEDGYLYREVFDKSLPFEFNTTNDIYRLINNEISNIVNSRETNQLFYAFYPRTTASTEFANVVTTFSNLDGANLTVGSTANVKLGMSVTGTNIADDVYVDVIYSNTKVGLNTVSANVGTVSGNITFGGINHLLWNTSSVTVNGCTGYFVDTANVITQVGETVSGDTSYIRKGAIVKLSVNKLSNVASATAGISGGSVTTISVNDQGDEYYVPPIVSFIGGGGSGASATATIAANGAISGITITNGGSGYTSAPKVVFIGGGGFFDARNQVKTGILEKQGDKQYIYSTMLNVLSDGTNQGLGSLSDGSGPITTNQNIPNDDMVVVDGKPIAVVGEIFAAFTNDFSDTLIDTIVTYMESYKDFALRYDISSYSWKIILAEDISTATFSLDHAGDTSGNNLDSSWVIYFNATGKTYNIQYRGLNYVFESEQETNFYFDNTVKIYDPETGFTIRDQVKVLRVNSKPDGSAPLALDYSWYIYDNIVEVDGYENKSKILVTYTDANNDGIPDNPELFENIVDPIIDYKSKFVYFQDVTGEDNFVVKQPINNADVISTYASYNDILAKKTLYTSGQLFYVPGEVINGVPQTNQFYQLTISGSTNNLYTLSEVTGYTAKIGRQGLYFQYRHNSPNYRRIDPSPNNIIDLYILTKQYATDYVAWIQDTSNTVSEPAIPSSEMLQLDFNSLENYKSISDTIIYNPAKFKPLFGSKAESNLQAIFKVVKNPTINVSDNDVKASVIKAINDYFAIENWNFGETFYFSELSAFLHTVLAPNIASIIIVPANSNNAFGSLMQVNADFNEIIISAATVDNVQIISAITAAQLNQAS